jgi:acyl-CoA thioesterase
MPEALFIRVGDEFEPTGLTRSFWSESAQHGGPPVGLLARAIENVPTSVPMQVVRLTVDLFRPVPIDAPIRTETEVVRDGRRIQVVEASLVAGSQTVARSSALKIRTSHVALPRTPVPWVAPPGPFEAEAISWARSGDAQPALNFFHIHAIEVRTVDGSLFTPGEGLSWVRLAVPVVEGEPTTPLVATATLSDVGNGNAMALDGRAWLYVNPDLSLTLHRLPEGDWLGMRSVAHQHRSGIGSAESQLFDTSGPVGRVVQSQIVEPRTDSRMT